jgi:hypothetical protein
LKKPTWHYEVPKTGERIAVYANPAVTPYELLTRLEPVHDLARRIQLPIQSCWEAAPTDGVNMRTSSIGLAAAAVLTVASFNSAAAGFAQRHSFMPHFHPGMANHFREGGRFGQRESRAFRRSRDFSVFPWGYFPWGYGDPLGYGYNDSAPSPFDAGGFAFGGGAPIVNITIAAPAQSAASPPRSYAAYPDPKIIMVGKRPRSTHFSKMPVVIYGGMQTGRTY